MWFCSVGLSECLPEVGEHVLEEGEEDDDVVVDEEEGNAHYFEKFHQ